MGLNEDGVTYLVNNFWDKCKKTYVPQIDGKGLSTEDYTTEEKDRLASLNILIGNEELQTTAKTVTSAINEILGASIDGHLLSNITDEDGVHNIRYNNNLLQIKKNDTWKDIPYLTSNVESSLKAKIYLGSGTVIVDSMTGEELYVNEYYIDALGNGSFYSVTQDGNAVLDTVNYTTYCAKASHTHTISNITNLQATLDGKANTHSHPYLSTSGGTVTGNVHVKNGQIYINNNTALYTYNTSGTAFPLVYINASNQVLLGHSTYSANNYYYTAGNHYFNKGVLISSGNLGSQSPYTSGFAMYGKWRDGVNHDIVGKSDNGLGCFLGWTGSASYATVCTIRGRTCKYTNSNGTTTLSDKNLKKDFESFSEAHDNFFDNLKPTTYKFILGSSGRHHFGYITQEVEEALEKAGLTTKDFGGVNIIKLTSRETETDIDENGNEIQKDIEESSTNYLLDKNINEEHDLIYTEFISLNTWQIQKLKKRVKEQEERIAKLESLIM